MMGRFLGQFGLSLAVAPIMPTDFFPVNFYQMLKRQTRKSLNEFKAIWRIDNKSALCHNIAYIGVRNKTQSLAS